MNRDYNTSNDKITNALNNMSKSLKSLAETATVQIELPKINSNDPGKVLTVVGSGEDVRWDKAEPATELPEVTSEDAGDVLTVNNDGEWVNVTPSKTYEYVSHAATTNVTADTPTDIDIFTGEDLPSRGTYRIKVLHNATGDYYWYEIFVSTGYSGTTPTQGLVYKVLKGTEYVTEITFKTNNVTQPMNPVTNLTATVTVNTNSPITIDLYKYTFDA